jgi:GNAT superfamily N-acetyltransferase
MTETPAYAENGTLRIRAMQPGDILDLSEGFRKQGWHKPAEQYEAYLGKQNAGLHRVVVAEVDGHAVGYAILAPQADHGPHAGKGYPEIRDFNVLIPFQGKGIGGLLMDVLEGLAAQTSKVVTLGVGMHSGYGSAQRMYVKRGYVPDGSGVWYQDTLLPQEAPCRNDDDLVLYLSKDL